MNKKILIGIGIVFMLVSITMVSALENKDENRKESPLYKIRTRSTIGEKIEGLKANSVCKRIFFLPFQQLTYERYLNEDVLMTLPGGGWPCTFWYQCRITGEIRCPDK